MNGTEKQWRLDVALVRAGFVSFGLSLAAWLAARYVQSVPARATLQVSAALFFTTLALLLTVAVLAQADLKRAMAALNGSVERAVAGRYFDAEAASPGCQPASLPVGYSRWSRSVEQLVGMVQDYGRLVVGLLDEMPNGVALLTRDSKLLAANREFCRMFEVERPDFEGRTLQEVLPAGFAEHWSPLAVSAASWYGRNAWEVRDALSGRVFRSSLGQLPPGRVVRGLMALVVEEVAEQPAIEASPIQFRELYSGILDAFPESLIVAARGGLVWDMNISASGLLGYSREQVFDLPLAQFLAPNPEVSSAHRLDSILASAEWRLDGKLLEASFAGGSGATLRVEVRLREWCFEKEPLLVLAIRDVSEESRSRLLTNERAETLEMMSTGQSQQAVLSRLTQLVERQLPGSVAVILLRRGDRLFPCATPNVPRNLLRAHEGLTMNSSDAPHVTAANESGFVVIPNLDARPLRGDLRHAALEEHLQACWSMPILSNEGLVAGAIVVYRRGSGEPDKGQEEVVRMVARLVALSLEQQEYADRLAYRAQHDAVTGLPNRRPFENWLKRALASAKRHSRPLSVISVGVDGFRQTNGSLCPDGADGILRGVAPRLRGFVRETDIVARWGGDEFKIGLAELNDKGDAVAVAGRLQESLGSPIEVNGQQFTLKPAIGVSVYPDDAQDPDSLIASADGAMHLASSARTSAPE